LISPVKRALKGIARESFFASALDIFREFITAEPATPNYRDLREAVFDPITHTCTVRGAKQ